MTAASRIAQPLLDRLRDVRAAVHGNDADLVDVLLQNGDVLGRLEDVVVVVIARR